MKKKKFVTSTIFNNKYFLFVRVQYYEYQNMKFMFHKQLKCPKESKHEISVLQYNHFFSSTYTHQITKTLNKMKVKRQYIDKLGRENKIKSTK